MRGWRTKLPIDCAQPLPTDLYSATFHGRGVWWSMRTVANLEDARAQMGIIVGLAADVGRRNPADCPPPPRTFNILAFGSRKSKRVCHSSFAGETNAYCTGSDWGQAAAQQVAELDPKGQLPPVDIYSDCYSLVEASRSGYKPDQRTLWISLQQIRTDLEDEMVRSLGFVPTMMQLANGLTKWEEQEDAFCMMERVYPADGGAEVARLKPHGVSAAVMADAQLQVEADADAAGVAQRAVTASWLTGMWGLTRAGLRYSVCRRPW